MNGTAAMMPSSPGRKIEREKLALTAGRAYEIGSLASEGRAHSQLQSPLRPAWKASSVFQTAPNASRIDAAWSIQIELPRGTVIALSEQTTD